VRHDVVRGSRGVRLHDEPAANEKLGEGAPDDHNQIQEAGDPGAEARRRFNSFHYFIVS
jgi:hypothetical protein